MSEPRWNDGGTSPLPRDTPRPYPGPRTRHGRLSAVHGKQPAAERSPRWGALPAGRGIVLMISGAAIGTVFTVLTGGEPGFVLGFFLVIATLAASFAVRLGAVYRIIPVPALTYLVGAVIAGMIHDRATDTSRTALAISAAQWIARGFLAMTAATVLVILIGAVRWGGQWRRSGGVGPRVPVSPRSTASPRSTSALGTGGLGSTSALGTGGLGSTGDLGSTRGAGGPQSARGLRGSGAPRSAGSPRIAGGPSGTGSPRIAGGPSGATGASGSRSPAGPRASAGGDDRRRNTPPGPGR